MVLHLEKSSTTTNKTGCSSMSAEYRNINLLQEEISQLNELSCSYYETGQLESALAHFKNGLAAVRRISQLKQDLAQRNGCDLLRKAHEHRTDQSFAMRADERRPGSCLLPIDSDSNVCRCVHWEKVSIVTLLHNAAMVHCKARAYTRAKTMIDLACQTLHSTKQTNKSLHRLMETNKYVVTVVASLYTCTGRVLLRLSKSLQHDKCKSAHRQAQVERAYQTASSFLEHYQEKQEEEKRAPVCMPKKKSVSLSPDSIPVCSPERVISCDAITSAGAMDTMSETIVSEYPDQRMTPILLETPPLKAIEPHQKAKKMWLDMLQLPA
jgi:hypothetical protein